MQQISILVSHSLVLHLLALYQGQKHEKNYNVKLKMILINIFPVKYKIKRYKPCCKDITVGKSCKKRTNPRIRKQLLHERGKRKLSKIKCTCHVLSSLSVWYFMIIIQIKINISYLLYSCWKVCFWKNSLGLN